MFLNKLVVEVGCTSDYLAAPSFAVVDITPAFMQRLERLRAVCKDHDIQRVSVCSSPDEWDGQDTLRITGNELNVSDDYFWFEACLKHSDSEINTCLVNIDHLTRVVNSGSTDPERPDMLLQLGILYCGGVPEDLADIHLQHLACGSNALVEG